ncbi:MocR-like pyridoxine biosynthesis transcription factor PdxR [Nonomuraea cavernae]|uniref:GntR family transcriptional regulator n=1 Tax=Nonomuraea cavernae TaxID=2045107 RepID=A0A918DFE0_9ACTN|nr:PLP-dependent aminotransferase family protein [Nonomuraea cavernae]MCA2184184.1 PLP-dependent aminotransferase family protein [Nonomuraea cavernae]GGO62563.1 GntR family transcriptional regulator [Nonomuraea cavernae]
MDVHVTLSGRGDLAAQVYRQLLEAILDGRLRSGERLPPTRELARRLEISRNTVAVAYDRLVADGFLAGRAGAGTFVSAEPVRGRAAPKGVVRPRAVWETIPPFSPMAPATYDFRVGVPDPRLFPIESWRRLMAHESRASTAGYGDPAGHEGLREAISRHIGISRSVRAGAGDVLITNGAQQALDLVGRVLVEPGACVAVEEPGYPPARLLFRSLGARVAGVPVDGEGIDVSAIPSAARLVYVTPSHQFPLGTPMSLARRAALLAWAKRRQAVVIEDDYDSEFRFGDRPLEPLQSLDRAGRVIYVGSFSKTLLPTLRLGFLVAPASLGPALRAARRLTDWHGTLPVQATLARFIDEGLLARHIRKATREYAARHALIADALDRDDRLRRVPSVAGLHLCARFAPGVSVRPAPELAVEQLDAYRGETTAQPGLVLGYGAIGQQAIPEGLRLLARSLIPEGRSAGR